MGYFEKVCAVSALCVHALMIAESHNRTVAVQDRFGFLCLEVIGQVRIVTNVSGLDRTQQSVIRFADVECNL